MNIVESADLELGERAAVLTEQRADPLSRAVRVGYLAAGVLAVGLALAAVVGLAVVTARQRRREVAVLGLLGADRREIARAVGSELVPPVIAGIVLGSATGWLVVTMFDGRFDLSAFADGAAVTVSPDLVSVATAAAATMLVSLVLVGWLVRRIVLARVSEILRVDGDA